MKKSIHILLAKISLVRSDIVMICLTGILRVAAMLGTVYLSKRLIDVATGRFPGDMLYITLILVACFAVMIFADAVTSRKIRLTEIKLQIRLQHSVFSRLLDADSAAVEKYSSGDLVNRLELDVRETARLIAELVPTAVITAIQLLAAFLFFFSLDRTLAVLTVCIMPVFLLAGKAYFRRMRELTHRIRRTDSTIQSLMQEGIQHGATIKTLEASGYLAEKAGVLQDELYEGVRERTRYNVLSRTAVTTGFVAGYLAVFLWGAYGLQSGAVTFGLMAAFLQLAGQVQRPVVGLAGMLPSFISGITSIERLNEPEEIPAEEDGDPVLLKGVPGVRFTNLFFGYEDRDQRVFEDFSFDFRPGTSTAVIGETGAGKTSLIRLMLGLRKPGAGTVTVYDSGEAHPASALTRPNFVYVPQGNTLFSGTIRENLLIANPGVSEAEMTVALQTACAGFVLDLPKGLDTPCRESGGGLSEGQAQRVAIARALLRPGRLLLLDEATSALDAETENRLLGNLRSFAQDKTVIFITHKAIGAQFCDRILKLN